MTYEVSGVRQWVLQPASVVEEVLQNVACLMSIGRGTVPLERGLGIDVELLDAPIIAAKSRLAADLAEQLAEFEPRAKLQSLTFEGDAADGTLKPLATIIIDNSEGSD